MRLNGFWAAIIGVVLLAFWATPALAQDPGGGPADGGGVQPADGGGVPLMAAGARIELIVSSDYSFDTPAGEFDVDGDFGAGFGFMFEYRVWDYIKVGPDMVIATVKAERANDRDVLFDLGVRTTGFYPLRNLGPIRVLSPYGFLTMGFAAYIPGTDNVDNEYGFWVAGGVGAEAAFGAFSVFAEFGGQGNMNGDYSYTGFQLTFGGKYLF